jgi:hypothetical protein
MRFGVKQNLRQTTEVNLFRIWCRRRDLNPHARKDTAP